MLRDLWWEALRDGGTFFHCILLYGVFFLDHVNVMTYSKKEEVLVLRNDYSMSLKV